MKTRFTTIILLSMFLFFSCSSENEKLTDCIEYQKVFVDEVNGPSTANVGETINIEVKFRVYNGCGRFLEFIETGTEFNKTIEVKAIYKGCICTLNIPTRTAIYKFTPSQPGEYKLKFRTVNNDFIILNITVS
ncbi:MAG TPA: hypothetical protein VFI78_00305 [Salinimicrobium sp.]|nr:hypothetical protein [Salinimicrobium sp.]